MPGNETWSYIPERAHPTVCLPHAESCRASMSDSGQPAVDVGVAAEAASIATAVRRALEGRVMVKS